MDKKYDQQHVQDEFFDAFDDFLKIHIKPHPTNKTIITFEDGEQTMYDGG